MSHNEYYQNRLREIIAVVRASFSSDSPEQACLQTILSKPRNIYQQTALLHLVAAPDRDSTARALSNVKNLSDNHAGTHILTALNAIPDLGKNIIFREFMARKDCYYLSENNAWYVPNAYYFRDEKNLRAVEKEILPEWKEIYNAAFHDFLLSGEKAAGRNRLSYIELCCVAGFLLPTREDQDSYIKIVGGKSRNTQYHINRLKTAHEFVEDYCIRQKISQPCYSISDYIGTSKALKDNVPSDMPGTSRTGPAFVPKYDLERQRERAHAAQINAKTQQLRAARLAKENGAMVSENDARSSAKERVPKGRNGFDLSGAMTFLRVARKSGAVQITDRQLQIFQRGAEENGLSVDDLAKEFETTAFNVRFLYAGVRKEFRGTEFIPPKL